MFSLHRKRLTAQHNMKLSTVTATLGFSAAAAAAASASKFINYTTVQGYFIQDDPSTDPSSFDYVRLS